MKILFIVDYYYPYIGGAEVVHQKLAEYLAQHHEVTVLTQSLPNALDEEVINQVKVIRVGVWHRVLFSWQARSMALKMAKEADIVQVSTYASAFLGSMIKNQLHKPVILLVHGYLRQFWYQLGLPKWFARFCHYYEDQLFSCSFDHYIVPSNFTATNLFKKGIVQQKVHVIHHGIDHDLFHPLPRNESLRAQLKISSSDKVFLFSGRPSRMKGIEFLLEAFKQTPKHIKLVLMLSKDSPVEFRRVVNFIAKNQLTEQVLLIDPVSHTDMPNYLAIADIVVVPSLTEEFCFLAAETCAMNIPLIVSHVAALPEVVSGKVCFVEPGSTQSLVDAIRHAVENDFVWIPAKKWDWNQSLPKYERLYTKILDDPLSRI